MRDVTLDDTFYVLFTTRAFSTGIPTTLSGTPVVSAYENNSLTQITAGVSLTPDHDGVTGLNLLTIVATTANTFESGKDYSLVITTGTVDSVSAVGEVVGEFSIERSAAAVDLANGTDGLGAIKTETANILTDTAEIGAAGAGLTAINLPNQTMDITGNLSGSVGSVTGAVGSVTGAVGSVTGTVGGIAGTITTLDALDTAQDTQHTTTQGKIDAVAADQKPKRGTALSDIPIYLVNSSDGTPATGKAGSATVEISKDGGAFAAAAGVFAEIGSGLYQFDATGADMTADLLVIKVTDTGVKPFLMSISTVD